MSTREEVSQDVKRFEINKSVSVEDKAAFLTESQAEPTPTLDAIDHLLNDLFYSSSGDINSNVQVQFDSERSAAGCSWSPVTSSCHHGLHCPFTAKILGLDQLQHPRSLAPSLPVTSQGSKVHNVVVLKQTPEGLVTVQQSFSLPQHQFASFQNFKNQAFKQGIRTSMSQTMPVPVTSSSLGYHQRQPSHPDTSHTMSETMPLSDISNSGRMVYRPPANSVVVKVPQPQPQQQHVGGQGDSAILCADCDSQFADNKSLVKHTRNQHQVYQCSKCGESTVGYYRMASHTKKKHSKEPVYFCNCGRNFSEKRGLTKHQNSCTFYNNS